jgi:hypothetical protein
MRQPYEVYRKYQRLLKSELSLEIDRRVKISHINCRYNKSVSLEGQPTIRLCTYGQKVSQSLDVGELLVCNNCKQARECSAYNPLYKSREEASAALSLELKDPAEKNRKFPVLIALEWVMDNTLFELKQNPPTRRHRMLRWVIRKTESLLIRLESWYRSIQ